MPDEQPPITITITIPDEPPNGSIVLAGGPAGDAWQRYNGLWDSKPPREARWFPTVGWWDSVTSESRRDPMTWPQFITHAREIHIVRWGDGKPPEDAK
jgi:hypothetical protein